MIETGFEPAKRNAAELKSDPFDLTRALYLETHHSTTPPPLGSVRVALTSFVTSRAWRMGASYKRNTI